MPVINYMSLHLSIPEVQLRDALKHRRVTAMTAVYTLMCKRLQRNRGFPDQDQNDVLMAHSKELTEQDAQVVTRSEVVKIILHLLYHDILKYIDVQCTSTCIETVSMLVL